jgi:hypothetical protein
MDNSGVTLPASTPVRDAVAEAQTTAREQIVALWQMQVDRVREQLEGGWREQLDRVFDERFSEVQTRLEHEFQHSVATAAQAIEQRESARARDASRSEVTQQLNETARRMKHAESREVWIQALLERAGDYCERAALFAVKGRTLRYEGGLGINEDNGNTTIDVSLDNAPAFASAVESKDTTVAAATGRELSDDIVRLVGEAADKRAYLFPFTFRRQVVGILYGETGARGINVSGLELLTSLAETTIEAEPVTAARASDLVAISPAEEIRPPSRPDQERHAAAERFARTRVAELMLYHIQRVKSGRAANDVYGALKDEIDAARQAYRETFAGASNAPPDYLHAELIRTLARGDAAALGPAYPGALA